MFSSGLGAVALAPVAAISDSDSTNFKSIVVTIASSDRQANDVLGLNLAASQKLSSAGFTSTYTNGVLTLSTSGTGTLTTADAQAIIQGVTFNTIASITTIQTRAITVALQDNSSNSATDIGNSTIALTLKAAPYARVADGTLTLTGDAYANLVTVDMNAQRILANGATVSVSGDPLFKANDINAAASTTAVQVTGIIKQTILLVALVLIRLLVVAVTIRLMQALAMIRS
jgi:hypothetical protein